MVNITTVGYGFELRYLSSRASLHDFMFLEVVSHIVFFVKDNPFSLKVIQDSIPIHSWVL